MIVHRLKQSAGRSPVGVDVWSVWLNEHVQLWCQEAPLAPVDMIPNGAVNSVGMEVANVTIFPKFVTCPVCLEAQQAAEVVRHVKRPVPYGWPEYSFGVDLERLAQMSNVSRIPGESDALLRLRVKKAMGIR